MKPPTKAELEALVRHYQPFTQTSDWEVTVRVKRLLCVPPTPLAEVTTVARTRRSVMEFFTENMHARRDDDPPWVPGEIVIHELLHLPVWSIMRASAKCYDEGEIPEYLEQVEEDVAEPIVDSLSRTLYRYLPKCRADRWR